MAGPATAPADLFAVGANHRSSSVALRDRLYIEEASIASVYDDLRAAGVAQAIVLSTCDRVEIQGAGLFADDAAARAGAVLERRAALAPGETRDAFYFHRGAAAVRHMFAVASSLDSMIVGETQVSGQVRAAHREARAHGLVGGELESALQAAYVAAKRVRSETPIGQGAVSMANAATRIAADVHGDLAGRGGLLIGLGEMGEDIAGRLLAAGLGHLVVSHPAAARGEAMARRLGCHHHPYDRLEDALAGADIVITALGAGFPLITAAQVAQALRTRRRQPIFLLDLAVPADIDPAVDALDDAFLYSLDDLEEVALSARGMREEATNAAWTIVDDEVNAFLADREGRRAVTTVVRLREHFEMIRAGVLSEGIADPDEATRRLVNRLLHRPSETLRELAAGGEDADELESLVRRLFGLVDPMPEPDAEDDP